MFRIIITTNRKQLSTSNYKFTRGEHYSMHLFAFNRPAPTNIIDSSSASYKAHQEALTSNVSLVTALGQAEASFLMNR